jgi:hypothetical protein
MRPLSTLALGIVSALGLAGCAFDPTEEDAEADHGELRTDPIGRVSTNDTNVRLSAGFNALLDRATPGECVVPRGERSADVGGIEGKTYLRRIGSKDDLAKELEVDVAVSGKLPSVNAAASVKLVNTYKQSTTKVAFLLRDVRAYTVTDRSALSLTPEAARLASRANDFVLRCGGAYVQSITYRAEVAVILEFEARSVEDARKIETSLGVSAPGVPAEVKTGLKTSVAELSQSHRLSVTVAASGFVADTKLTEGMEQDTVGKFEGLRAQLDKSFRADLERDRGPGSWFANRKHDVVPAVVTQASYAALPGVIRRESFGKITQLLGDAEKFYAKHATLAARLDRVYNDEIRRFLDDSKNQFRYNTITAPKKTTSEVVVAARSYAAVIDPRREGSVGHGVAKLAENCLRNAANGDYSACKDTNEDWSGAASALLAAYEREGRIVELAGFVPMSGTDPKTFSYRNAAPACAEWGMRVANRADLAWLAPMVDVVAAPAGEVWIAPEASCTTPYYSNDAGVAKFACETSAAEALPYVRDRPVICVPAIGAVPVLPSP